MEALLLYVYWSLNIHKKRFYVCKWVGKWPWRRLALGLVMGTRVAL